MSSSTLNCLQGGRAAAALAVTAFHLSLMMGEPRYGGDAALWPWMQFGRLGVDFFFVLSGFVILHAHRQDIGQPDALPRYLWRRFVRLFPVYWLYTAGFVALVAVGLGRHAQLPEDALDWVSAWSLIRLSRADPPLYVAWTLFHEMAFYAVFALLLIHRWLGLTVLAGWGLVCLVLQGYPGQDPGSIRLTYLSVVNLDFLMGMGACLLAPRLNRAWPPMLAGLLLLGMALAQWPLAHAAGYLLVGAGFACIVCAMAVHERTHGLRLPAGWRLLGDASYSLYLLHLPLGGMVLKATVAAGLPQALGAAGTLALALAATVALGVLAYRLVEAPLLAWMRDRIRGPKEPLSRRLRAAGRIAHGPGMSPGKTRYF